MNHNPSEKAVSKTEQDTKASTKSKKTKELSNGFEMASKSDTMRTKDGKMKEDLMLGGSENTKERKKKKKDEVTRTKGDGEDEGEMKTVVLRKERKKKLSEVKERDEMCSDENGSTTKNDEKLLDKNESQIPEFAQFNGDDQNNKNVVKNADVNVDQETTLLNGKSKNSKIASMSLLSNEVENKVERDSNKKSISSSQDLLTGSDKPPQRSRLSSDRTEGKKLSNGTSLKKGRSSRESSRSISPSKDKNSLGDEFDLLNGPSIRKSKKERKKTGKSIGDVEKEKDDDEVFGNDEPIHKEKMLSNLLDEDGDDDVFLVDELPRFAKSYILPRVMNKENIEARMRKDETDMSEGGAGMDRRSQCKSETAEEEKNLEAFKFSMLKASLDYDSGFVGGVPPAPPRCQFYQHFTCNYFVRKCFAHLFFNFILAL